MSKIQLAEEERQLNKLELLDEWEHFPCKGEIDDFFYPEIIERTPFFTDAKERASCFNAPEQEWEYTKSCISEYLQAHLMRWLTLGQIARNQNMDICQVRGALYEMLEVGCPVEKKRLVKNRRKVLCYRMFPSIYDKEGW